MYSDQMRKYGICWSMMQALYYDIFGNKVIIRACSMEALYYDIVGNKVIIRACSMDSELYMCTASIPPGLKKSLYMYILSFNSLLNKWLYTCRASISPWTMGHSFTEQRAIYTCAELQSLPEQWGIASIPHWTKGYTRVELQSHQGHSIKG